MALYLLITDCRLYKQLKLISFHLLLAAVEFLKRVPEGKYDAIIVDSSDPVGMSFI